MLNIYKGTPVRACQEGAGIVFRHLHRYMFAFGLSGPSCRPPLRHGAPRIACKRHPKCQRCTGKGAGQQRGQVRVQPRWICKHAVRQGAVPARNLVPTHSCPVLALGIFSSLNGRRQTFSHRMHRPRCLPHSLPVCAWCWHQALELPHQDNGTRYGWVFYWYA